MASASIDGSVTSKMPEPWFSIPGDDILEALRLVAEGMKPETAYALLKVSAHREGVDDARQERPAE